METNRIEELEQLLSKAHAMRTEAYKIKTNRQFISVLNDNIWNWATELALLKVGA